MIKMTKVIKYGKKGSQYTDQQINRFTNVVYVNIYSLSTEDWFEVGEKYSLHLTERGALNHREPNWWAPHKKAVPVFVTESTLEKIAKSGRRGISNSWEN